MMEKPPIDPATLRTKALAFLARREHARQELQQKLVQRGYSNTEVCAVLDALTAEGFLSEARYAEAYTLSRAHRGYGPLRVAHELRQRGISNAHIAAAIDHIDTEWNAALSAFYRKKFRTVPQDRVERSAQTRLLQQRGFDRRHIDALFASLLTP